MTEERRFADRLLGGGHRDRERISWLLSALPRFMDDSGGFRGDEGRRSMRGAALSKDLEIAVVFPRQGSTASCSRPPRLSLIRVHSGVHPGKHG